MATRTKRRGANDQQRRAGLKGAAARRRKAAAVPKGPPVPVVLVRGNEGHWHGLDRYRLFGGAYGAQRDTKVAAGKVNAKAWAAFVARHPAPEWMPGSIVGPVLGIKRSTIAKGVAENRVRAGDFRIGGRLVFRFVRVEDLSSDFVK